MAVYGTNEFKNGLKVMIDNDPCNIVDLDFVKPGKGQAFTRTKFKNLLTGAVIERNIRSGEKLEPANVEEKEMQFLYKEGGDFVFMDPVSYEQVTISADLIGDDSRWMLDNISVQVLFFNERAVGVTLPNFVLLKITETSDGARGNSVAGNVTKPAVVETGAEVGVPIFIKLGDMIRIDTRTGSYVERVNQ